MKKISLFLLSMMALSAQARTINVADYGLTPGGDSTYALGAMLESVKGEEDLTIYFPEGEYHFKPENANERYQAVTNHDNSVRRIAFDLLGFEGVTIDGGGSTFVFYGLLNPFIIDSSEDITLKNFSIKWDSPCNDEMKVVEVNEADNSFVAEVLSKYEAKIVGKDLIFPNYGWDAVLSRNYAFNPETGIIYYDNSRYSIKAGGCDIKKVGKNRFSFKNATKELPPVGTLYSNTTKVPFRLAQAVQMIRSKNIVVEDVNIHSAGGMGIIAERTDGVELTRLNIVPAEGRIFSVAADATHFNGCKGLVKLTDCNFKNMGDDAINVHGSYVDVVEYLGDNQFLCEIHHFQQAGFNFSTKGDVVMLTSRKDVQPLFETSVTNTRVINERRFVITVSDMPAKLPEGPLSFENITWYPDVVMTGCTSAGNRARAALISTKGDALLENNHFCSDMHGILLEGDNKSWYESGGVRNVVIRNNVFENTGYASGPSKAVFPLFASPMLTADQNYGDDQFHWNLTFSGNTLRGFQSRLVHACSVKNLTIENNTIEKTDDYPEEKTEVAIELDYCNDVVISGNSWSGFDYKPTLSAKDSENVVVKKNKGAAF